MKIKEETGFLPAFTEQGTGEALVLLHGNGEDGSYFINQTEFFKANYWVIAVDTRGHGRSPRGAAPFSLGQFAEDLKQLLDHLELEKIHLLGFSDGANIAMLFALKYPEYLKSLILNGGNLRPSGVKWKVQAPIILGYGMISLIALFDKKAMAKKEILGLMVKEPKIRPEVMEGITVPVLVIAGSKDMIRASHTKEIHQAIPGSRLCILEGDHFIAAKEPEAFNRAVQKFINEVTGDQKGE